MLASVPPSVLRRSAGALIAALCLALATPAAAAEKPSAEVLWKAYPLDPGPPASAAPPSNGDAPTRAQLPVRSPAADEVAPAPPSLAVTVVFFGALGIVVLVCGAALIRRATRRARTRSVTPPRGMTGATHG